MKLTALLTLFSALVLTSCGSEPPADIRIGQTLPSFTLKALDGTIFKSKNPSDGPVIINFWATWCQPCRKELPILKSLSADAKAEVIGIALDEGGAGPVGKFVKQHDINYTVLLGNQDIFRRFKGYAIPYTLILDRSGKIVNIHRGPASMESFEKDLAGI